MTTDSARKGIETGWRPIETAPMDGTTILLWSEQLKSWSVGCWSNLTGLWRYYCPDVIRPDKDQNPTHWQPLPDPHDAPQENQPPFHANNVGPNGEGLRYESSVLDELVAEAQEQDMGYGTEEVDVEELVERMHRLATDLNSEGWYTWANRADEAAKTLKRMENKRDKNWQRYVDADAALLDAQEELEAIQEAWGNFEYLKCTVY